MNIATRVPTCWAFADEAADLVQTFTLVQTGRAGALVYLNLTMSPLKSCMHDENTFLGFRNGLYGFLLSSVNNSTTEVSAQYYQYLFVCRKC